MEKVPYGKRYYYPNMKHQETLMWERFLDKFPDAYDQVIYNLKLGEGAEIPEDTEPNIANGFKQLTQHKIDVVGFKGEQVDILEIKPNAGLGAIGQVDGYRDLYIAHISASPDPGRILVTDILRPDTKMVADKKGIKIILV